MDKKKTIVISTIVLVVIVIFATTIIVQINKEKRNYQIEEIERYSYFVVKENDEFGVMDDAGNKIIETKYENIKIPNPSKGIFFCYNGDDVTIFNENTEEIFTEYDNVEPLRLKNISSDLMYEKSVLKYSLNGKYGIINFLGKEITKPIYDEIDTLQYKEGELLAQKDGKYGVINIKGAVLVKFKYSNIESDKYYLENENYLESGYIVSNITDDGYRYGYVNIKGKEILKTKFNELSRIVQIDSNDIYIICAENGKYGLYKNKKKIIENDYQALTYNESNDRIIVTKGKKYGVLSLEGEVIVPIEYQQIDVISKNIYATTNDDDIIVFDANGNELELDKNTVISDIDNTDYKIYIQIEENQTTYSIYENDKKKTKNKYTYIEYLYDDYFIVSNGQGELGVIDNNEMTIIGVKYDSIQRVDGTSLLQVSDSSDKTTAIYSEQMKQICQMQNAIIQKEDNYIKMYNESDVKYISKDGQEVQSAEIFKDNKLFANKFNGKWGFIDANGNKVVDYKYDYATELNEYGFAGIKLNDKWGIINSNGEIYYTNN